MRYARRTQRYLVLLARRAASRRLSNPNYLYWAVFGLLYNNFTRSRAATNYLNYAAFGLLYGLRAVGAGGGVASGVAPNYLYYAMFK